MTEAEKLPEPQLPGKLAEGFFTDQGSPKLRQIALRELGVVFKNVVGDDDAQNGVSEELLALVELGAALGFVGVGGMGHADFKKAEVLKFVAHPLFEQGYVFSFHSSSSLSFKRAAEMVALTSVSTKIFAWLMAFLKASGLLLP